MKRLAVFGGAIALALGSTHAGLIDTDLDTILAQTAEDGTVSALVYMVDQVDTDALTDQLDGQRATLRQRHETVVLALQDLAQTLQRDVILQLDGLKSEGAIVDYKAHWIGNIIRVDGTPDAIRAIAARADVQRVYYNYEIELTEPVRVGKSEPGAGGRGPEAGVEAVRAPEVWALGYTGEGVLVATLDTGVDGGHPALASRWRGDADPRYADNPEWAWFDPVTWTTSPTAFGSHGTHTMGTVCGGAPGDEVGVAPGAQWIHAAVIDRVDIPTTVADAIDSFGWMLDPDGDPSTMWDVPAVCSNSWRLVTGHGYPPCDETFWTFLDACEAAGTVIVFSAGNEGSGAETIGRPPDRATDDYRCFSVGAINPHDSSWPIAGFSSRGPSHCTPDGSAAIKPEISAPGVDTRSAMPGGGYGEMDGTSMASPHVNGVIALMRQANPDLSPEQVKDIIFATAYDLGSTGEDNNYGWGMIDAYDAVLMALETVALTFSFPDGKPTYIDPLGGETIRVEVHGQAVPAEPGTGIFYYSTGGDYTAVAMTEVEPNIYDAVFPIFDCGSHVTYYFSAEAETGEVAYNPFTAPDSTHAGDVYTGTIVDFQDDFETDMGWTVQDDAYITTGSWDRGVPLNDGRGDPPSDADGSGQCYVTGNSDDEDIDDGMTTLFSPNMDASDPEAAISYYRWYSNTYGSDPQNDIFVVRVSDDGGATWVELETVGPAGSEADGGWYHKEFLVADIPGVSNSDQFRISFEASDLGEGSVVEAAVDGIEISYMYCDDPTVPGDVTGDGIVDVVDLLAVLSAWGPCPDCPEDLNGDGVVDVLDLLIVLSNWS